MQLNITVVFIITWVVCLHPVVCIVSAPECPDLMIFIASRANLVGVAVHIVINGKGFMISKLLTVCEGARDLRIKTG